MATVMKPITFTIIIMILALERVCSFELSSHHQGTAADEKPKSPVMVATLTLITIIGLVANIITVIIIIMYGQDFPPVGRILLKNQAVADCFVCIMGIGMYVETFRWTSGNNTFDFLLCQVWHSQALFWGGVHISIWSLVFIAIERFVLISYPFKHRLIISSHIYITFVTIYVTSVIFTFPCYLQARYQQHHNVLTKNDNITVSKNDNMKAQSNNNITMSATTGKCLDKYYFDTDEFSHLMAHYGIFWIVIEYVIPTTLFIVLYSRVIWELQKQNKCMAGARHVPNQQQKKKSTLSVAERQLTRTAFAVTVVFIVALGVESWRYFLGRVGFIIYKKDTLQLVLGIFLATINSCSNPFVYSISLPIFRKHLKSLFRFN